MFVDSHAHLCSDELYPDIIAILERSLSANVSPILNICTDLVTLKRGLDLHVKYPWVFNAAATTPHDVDAFGETHFEEMAKAAGAGVLAAIGETGLDYHYSHSNHETQKNFLRRYCRLSKECNLPLVIHCRDAFQDLFTILDEEKPLEVILHCFTGTLEEAQQVIERDWYLSLSGIVTFKKSEALREVAKWVPLNRLLIETDAPYLAPGKYRGGLNEPALVVETAKMIAECKGSSLQEIGAETTNNAKRVLRL
jgi:TatD DNase family protein